MHKSFSYDLFRDSANRASCDLHNGRPKCKVGYYQLRHIRPVIRSLSTAAIKTLVQAFDHWLSLWLLLLTNLRRSRKCQSTTAVSSERRNTPCCMCQLPPTHHADSPYCLHWLPIQKHIPIQCGTRFKSLLCKTVVGWSTTPTPAYVCCDLQTVGCRWCRDGIMHLAITVSPAALCTSAWSRFRRELNTVLFKSWTAARSDCFMALGLRT